MSLRSNERFQNNQSNNRVYLFRKGARMFIPSPRPLTLLYAFSRSPFLSYGPCVLSGCPNRHHTYIKCKGKYVLLIRLKFFMSPFLLAFYFLWVYCFKRIEELRKFILMMCVFKIKSCFLEK